MWQKAPTDSSGTVPVVVREAQDADIAWWRDNIEPRLAQIQPRRADADWRWTWIAALVRLGGTRRQARVYTVATEAGGRRAVCALMALLERERYPLDDAREAAFVWYLSVAPAQLLHFFLPRDSVPVLLGQGCLDGAVERSLVVGHGGRTWLHAAPAGGDTLLDWYLRKCGMALVPATVDALPGLAGLPTRQNDGRYLYFDEPAARSFHDRFQPYR
jgi:hypothetical protein